MRTAGLLAYAAALGVGLFLTFRPTFESGFARAQTERGDGMLNHYILEHTWRALADPAHPGSFFSPPCFFPEPHTLWYSEHLLGVAPLYWGLRLAGVPYDLAYQWWQIVLAGLNFVAFAAAVRWLRGPHLVALLGGYLWAFSLVHAFQVMHQQMIPRFWMPVAAYHAWMLVLAVAAPAAHAPGPPDPDPDAPPDPADPARHLNRMLAAVFLQGVTCVNTGWFLAAGLGTFLALALTLTPGGWRGAARFWRERRGRVALILGGWAAALAAAFAPYLVVNWGQGRSYGESAGSGLIPTPAAWLAAPPGTVWERTVAPFRARVGDECWLFCGFGVYALMLAATAHLVAAGFRKGRPREAGLMLAALLTAAVWVVLTLTPADGSGRSLWEYVRHVPGGRAIRCVSRVYVTVYLFGTLGALVWLARVSGGLRPVARAAVLGAVAAACVAEQVGFDPPSFDKRDFYPIADRAGAELRRGDMRADIGYVLPRYTGTDGVTKDWVYGEVLAMWAGLRAGVPVLNGYSGRSPDGDFPCLGWPVPDLDRPIPDSLRKWLAGKFRGRVVVVEPEDPSITRVFVIE